LKLELWQSLCERITSLSVMPSHSSCECSLHCDLTSVKTSSLLTFISVQTVVLFNHLIFRVPGFRQSPLNCCLFPSGCAL